MASEHEGCASRAASEACSGLSRAGSRVSRCCPFVSGTRRSAVRGWGGAGTKSAWFYYLNATEGVISVFGEAFDSGYSSRSACVCPF